MIVEKGTTFNIFKQATLMTARGTKLQTSPRATSVSSTVHLIPRKGARRHGHHTSPRDSRHTRNRASSWTMTRDMRPVDGRHTTATLATFMRTTSRITSTAWEGPRSRRAGRSVRFMFKSATAGGVTETASEHGHMEERGTQHSPRCWRNHRCSFFQIWRENSPPSAH